ncbi:alpha/beta hydrolase [Streptomyces platensis]|uniref:alpha/beta fold hydrolase n=1 Tax=Streptomyces platensis TaxID=58346 RepID=UPI0030DE5187
MEQTIQNQKKWSAGGGSWVTADVYGEPDAPGLVVVPGAMSDAHAWRHVATAVDAWPSVTVVNRRGRTPSGPLTDGYSLRTEVEDLGLILDGCAGTPALFGWSYGGLIALLAANDRSLRQVIAYEPVMRPFGSHVLPGLKDAEEQADWEATVEIVNRQIAGLDTAQIETLRADRQGWADLQRLSRPAHAELAALNAAPPPQELARRADRVDLIVGQCNHGTAPYGTSFDDVRQRVARATRTEVHVLPGHGHMAHLQAPAELGHLLNGLATAR